MGVFPTFPEIRPSFPCVIALLFTNRHIFCPPDSNEYHLSRVIIVHEVTETVSLLSPLKQLEASWGYEQVPYPYACYDDDNKKFQVIGGKSHGPNLCRLRISTNIHTTFDDMPDLVYCALKDDRELFMTQLIDSPRVLNLHKCTIVHAITHS